jgi:hypothetical protein
MKTLLTNTAKFIIILSVLLHGALLVQATGEDEDRPIGPDCNDESLIHATQTLIPDITSSYIITELSEPVGGFDETLSNESFTTSGVYLKYKCVTSTTYYWGEDGASIEETTKDHEITDWNYIPYSGNVSCPEDASCTYVQLIIGRSGDEILKTYIAVMYRWGASIVGIIAVLVMVISGIQISMDQGGGEQVGAAKTRIMQSLSGLVILFLSALILYTINPTFFK